MRILFSSLGLLLIATTLSFAQPQQPPPPDLDACAFTVHGEPTRATVTGPGDIVPLVHVVEQPDSPIEVLSVDLTGMWLSVANGELAHNNCARYTLRNRSDRAIERTSVELQISPGGSYGVFSPSGGTSLAPGGTTEIKACNGGGHASGVHGDRVRLLVSVRSVEFENCTYLPSLRIPRSLGVHP